MILKLWVVAMTIRLDMLTAASRAKNLLGDSAELVANFICKQMNPDGGFKGRSSQSDLYYTVFGIEALLALQADVPRKQILSFLQRFRDCQSLDLVHLACLVRCLANLAPQPQDLSLPSSEAKGPKTQVTNYQLPVTNHQILHYIERHRCHDGGYSNSMGAEQGTAYGCFLALAAYQDLNMEMQNSSAVVKCVQSLQRPDGAYTNAQSSRIGSAPATAAALTVLHYLNEPISDSSTDWLLSCFHPKGGFAVMPTSQVNGLPDLLSTATVLHALSLIEVSTDNMKEQCLDFLDSLWSSKGGFRGNWADEILDCEYTYYGLLALGHLSD